MSQDRQWDMILREVSRLEKWPGEALKMAAQAVESGSVGGRADLLVILGGLPVKKQVFSFRGCVNRDELLQELERRDEYGAIVSIIRCDLAGWHPDASEFSHLKWLLEKLLIIKERAVGKAAMVILQMPTGQEMSESVSMMEALLDEAVEFAAGAWVRCLCGSGGQHRVWELPGGVLADRDLAEAIMGELSRDPRALTLLLEESEGRLATAGPPIDKLENCLRQGTKATAYCLEIISREMEKLQNIHIKRD